MICLYHRADLDGKGSGYLINRFLKPHYKNSEFIGMDYTDNCEFLLKKCKNEYVVIVDFGINKEVLLKLLDISKKILWIDHHTSSHEIMKDVIVDKRHTIILGDNSISAIEMVWNHFSSSPVPLWIQYISKYDTWHHNNTPNILLFILALENKAASFNNIIWNELYVNPEETMLNLINDGKLLQEYINGVNKFTVNEHAREIEFEGLIFLSINTTNKGSLQFKEHKNYEKYDFFMTYNLTKNGIWKYSMYTNNDNFDLSIIARKYNGGGHKGACGFSSDSLIIK